MDFIIAFAHKENISEALTDSIKIKNLHGFTNKVGFISSGNKTSTNSFKRRD